MPRLYSILVCLTVFLLAQSLLAQEGSRPPSVAVQKKKLEVLKAMDGVWRGEAWTMTPTGQRVEMVQTERVGTMLDGTIRVIEGRGYDSAGQVVFNAFAVISWDTANDQYTMRSYAQGRQGDFVISPTDDGFQWTIPAGPATIRYTASIRDGQWHESGERVVGNQQPVKFFEMHLKRVDDSAWPAAGAIPPK